jgi:hypothetical protein
MYTIKTFASYCVITSSVSHYAITYVQNQITMSSDLWMLKKY